MPLGNSFSVYWPAYDFHSELQWTSSPINRMLGLFIFFVYASIPLDVQNGHGPFLSSRPTPACRPSSSITAITYRRIPTDTDNLANSCPLFYLCYSASQWGGQQDVLSVHQYRL